MEIDDPFGEDLPFPRKLLDKKAYVRLDPETGIPQLIRIEPVTEDGEFLPEVVAVTIDNEAVMQMEREAVGAFIEQQNCIPLEEFADWKHRLEN